MKLFGIKHDGKLLKEEFFASKTEAKQKRDELNGGKPKELREKEKPVRYTVGIGPDHFRWEA